MGYHRFYRFLQTHRNRPHASQNLGVFPAAAKKEPNHHLYGIDAKSI
jgi:hypothetical protein